MILDGHPGEPGSQPRPTCWDCRTSWSWEIIPPGRLAWLVNGKMYRSIEIKQVRWRVSEAARRCQDQEPSLLNNPGFKISLSGFCQWLFQVVLQSFTENIGNDAVQGEHSFWESLWTWSLWRDSPCLWTWARSAGSKEFFFYQFSSHLQLSWWRLETRQRLERMGSTCLEDKSKGSPLQGFSLKNFSYVDPHQVGLPTGRDQPAGWSLGSTRCWSWSGCFPSSHWFFRSKVPFST